MGERSANALADLCDWIDKAPSAQDIQWQIKKAAAIKAWCLRSLDFGEGDRVIIASCVVSDRTSGWWPYREALAPGATGVVTGIDFNPYSYDGAGGWQADVVLDREWSYSEDLGKRWWNGPASETPEGYEPPSTYDQERNPEGRRHTFAISVDRLAPALASVSS